jgi:hypothetical protein
LRLALKSFGERKSGDKTLAQRLALNRTLPISDERAAKNVPKDEINKK